MLEQYRKPLCLWAVLAESQAFENQQQPNHLPNSISYL